jgi:5-methyltetrahydropteroyltriglutamate--homocysteine methyltransferase
MMIADDLRRIRVDQVGSLAAPRRLQELFLRHRRGEASSDALAQARDAAIRAIVLKQEAIGLPVVTDGELRRSNFQESFGAAVSGFEIAGADCHRDGAETRPLARAELDFDAPGPPIRTRRPVVARLQLTRNVPLEEYWRTAEIATRPVKVTILSPDRIAQRFAWERSRDIYRDMDEFLTDVVAIERDMIRALIAGGCRYIQIDAPGYTAYADEVSLMRMRARGEDPMRNLQRSIAADNALIAGFDGVTFGIHFCRGNPRTRDSATGQVMPQWHREGSYDPIAERLFTGLDHHRLLLEYDSERAGGFEPLRFVPQDKIAVLGLVTTKSAELESAEMLKRRIDDASRHLPLDQLALSPQCGFGGLDCVVLDQDDQWRKFERILETASAVWQ